MFTVQRDLIGYNRQGKVLVGCSCIASSPTVAWSLPGTARTHGYPTGLECLFSVPWWVLPIRLRKHGPRIPTSKFPRAILDHVMCPILRLSANCGESEMRLR